MDADRFSERHLQELKSIFGEERVLWREHDLYSYAFDASFGTYKPDAVVQLSTQLSGMMLLEVLAVLEQMDTIDF